MQKSFKNEKLDMKSKDILQENIYNIASLFPNTLVETEDGKKIDFDILKQELSKDIVEGNRERYHLDFPGKKEAIVEANRKTTKTLRPIKEKSVNFDNTKNIYIEGDNLEALKILQESYLGKIKCIYIDPPYNTGNDFVYNDDFSKKDEEEKISQGIIDKDGKYLVSSETINAETKGKYHSDWIKMMSSRLKLSRNLLSDDGVIFISIDDNEVDNLKKLCDEMFGENNFITRIIWHNNKKGRQMDKYIKTTNEFILLYAKEINNFVVNSKKVFVNEDEYKEADEISKYKKGYPLHNGTAAFHIYNRPNLCYSIYYNPDNNEAITIDEKVRSDEKIEIKISKKGQEYIRKGYYRIIPKINEKYHTQRVWRWGAEKFNNEYKTELLFVKEDKGYYIYQKERIDENGIAEQKYTNYIDIDTSKGKNDINSLFNNKVVFDFSKSVDLIQYVLKIVVERYSKNCIILDFFSGSATTAHAVMKLNAEDGGSRQFILVQLPEATDENSEAYKAGFKTICDIGEERIRRAGKKVKEENPILTQNLDNGFRVYKIDDSNMKDIYYTPDKIDQANLLDMVSNIKEDRTAEDLLTQVILNLGLPLDLHIDEKKIGNNKVFFVEQNVLVACFDEKVDISILDEISKASPLKICLRESSFEKDQDKINFIEKLKNLSKDSEIKMI